MAINLVRNSKVYFTTAVDPTTGIFASDGSALASTNTFELQVLDGYSFSQNTETQQITVNEAGVSPVRGSRTFNTALAPVDWSITTYVRPVRSAGIVQPAERVLWNALFGSRPISTSSVSAAVTRTNATSASAIIPGDFSASSTGDALNIANATQNPNEWNIPAVIRTANSTSATIEFLRAPATAAGLTSTAANIYTGQWAGNSGAGAYSYTSTMGSQKHQLQRFAMLFVVDNVVYCVDNCCVTQASVDFGIDQIAQIAWTGQGTALRQLTASSAAGIASQASTAVTTAGYITNKLSTMTLQSKVGGADNTSSTSSTSYVVAITGGNLTINNNVTYLTPADLGVVNKPITYFAGSRSISGNVTAYLKTGTDSPSGTGDLLTALLRASNSETEPKFKAVIQMGATSGQTAVPRLDFEMNGAMLQIPTVEIQDVVSTTINFVAQPFNPEYIGASGANTFDLERSNDLLVRYYSN